MKIKIKIPASSANLGSGFDCLSVALNLYNFYEVETHTKEMKQRYTFGTPQFSLKEDLLKKALEAGIFIFIFIIKNNRLLKKATNKFFP